LAQEIVVSSNDLTKIAGSSRTSLVQHYTLFFYPQRYSELS
jgi:hypothetical protein